MGDDTAKFCLPIKTGDAEWRPLQSSSDRPVCRTALDSAEEPTHSVLNACAITRAVTMSATWSALGQSRRFWPTELMSALPPLATRKCHVWTAPSWQGL